MNRMAESKQYYEYLSIKVIVAFFKVLGLAPWNVVKKSCGRKMLNNGIPQKLTSTQFAYSGLGSAYQIFLIAFISWINFMTIPDIRDKDYPLKTELTVMIELIQAICGNAVVVVIRIIYFVKQNTVVKIFNRFTTIDSMILGADNTCSFKSNRFYFLLLFLSTILSWVVVLVLDIYFGGFPLIGAFNDILPAIIINFFMIEYVIMVKLIEYRFQALNQALLGSSRSSIAQPIPSSFLEGMTESAFYKPKIIHFRRTHTVLYEIACDISDFFSLPILLTIAFTCFSIIYNAYYLIMPLIMRLTVNTVWVIGSPLGWLIGLVLPIIMLTVAADRTTYELKKTADAVHKLLARCNNTQDDNFELQQFSLELLQRNIYFTAYGFFPLDCTLVHSIFSMVVTYLIILYQFKLASEEPDSQNYMKNYSSTES